MTPTGIALLSGWEALKAFSRLKIHIKGDELILGDSDFVASVLEEQNERFVRRHHLQAHGVDFDKITNRVANIFHLKPEQVLNSGKQSQRAKARSLLCYLAVKELEKTGKMSQKIEDNQFSGQPRCCTRRENRLRNEFKANGISETHKRNTVPLYLYRPHGSLGGRTPINKYFPVCNKTPFWDEVSDNYDDNNEERF